MAGFDNDIMYADNVDFRGVKPRAAQVVADGQLLIGATASPNIRVGSITSGDSSITVTAGAGTIALSVAGGTTVGKTITGDAGGALAPTAGNWNIVGTTAQGITSSGAGSTLTFTNADASETQKGVSELATDAEAIAGTDAVRTIVPTSLKAKLGTQTNHGILVGSGTTTAITALAAGTALQVLQSGGAGSDPAYSTATYPATTTISQILYSSSNNVVAGLATANRAVLTTDATGVPVLTALATDGQLLIGSTAGTPTAATLTAGTGISITNGAGAITIAAAGGGLTWTVVAADTSFTVNTGTIANKAGLLTMTLPASAVVGDIIRIVGENTALGWKIAQNANQQIFFGTASTTVGVTGSLASTAIRDAVEMVCTVAGASTVWTVLSSVGNITVA